jgi:hypothetical protein
VNKRLKTQSESMAGSLDVILIVLLVIVLAGGAGYYVYQNSNKPAAPVTPAVVAKLKRPGVVQALRFGTVLDSAGNIKTPGVDFKQTDSTIYITVGLNNAKKGSRIEYIRYRDDFMVDNGAVNIIKDGAQRIGFNFSLKPGQTHPIGTYKIKLYTNGVFETSGAYTIK